MVRNRKWLKGGVLAFVAALTLLVQTMSGTMVMAAPAAGQSISVCTAHGLQTITVAPAQDQQAPAHCPHCYQCITPAIAMVGGTVLAIAPVRYAIAIEAVRLAPALSPYAARAPPRPPSQAPPSILNV